jgi:hypothetical protein
MDLPKEISPVLFHFISAKIKEMMGAKRDQRKSSISFSLCQIKGNDGCQRGSKENLQT